MKKWLDRHFPKKLKVRISHYMWWHYKIQYCHYRFIPLFYYTLYRWSDSHKNQLGDGWFPIGGQYNAAINTAKEFDTIEKIREFNEKQWVLKSNYKKPNSLPSIKNVI